MTLRPFQDVASSQEQPSQIPVLASRSRVSRSRIPSTGLRVMERPGVAMAPPAFLVFQVTVVETASPVTRAIDFRIRPASRFQTISRETIADGPVSPDYLETCRTFHLVPATATTRPTRRETARLDFPRPAQSQALVMAIASRGSTTFRACPAVVIATPGRMVAPALFRPAVVVLAFPG